MDKLLLSGLTLLALSQAISGDVVKPRDTAVRVGDTDVKLRCTDSDPTTVAFWQFYMTRENMRQIYFYTYTGGQGTPNMVDPSYSIDTANLHDLIIPSATYDVAGTYLCTILTSGAPVEANAQLSVVDQMWCHPQVATVQDQEGYVELTCTVQVAGSLLPTLSWRHNNVELEGVLETIKIETLTELTYKTNITIEAEMTEEEFRCDLIFRDSSPDNRPPDYTDQCTSTIEVYHKVTRVMIKPNNDDVEGGGPVPIAVGDFITCNVSARPPAEITWYKMSGNGPVKVTKPSGIDNFSKLEIVPEMVGDEPASYRCEARNLVPGESQAIASKMVTLQVIQTGGGGASAGASKDPGGNGSSSLTDSSIFHLFSMLIFCAFLHKLELH